MSAEISLYILIAIIAVLVVVSIIKKAFKLLIVIIIFALGVSAYNMLFKGVTPKEEVRNYSTDIQYMKDITDYSGKIKTSVANFEKAISGNVTKDDIKIVHVEAENLRKYKTGVVALIHTSKLDPFHNKYFTYLSSIVDITSTAEKVISLGENKNYGKVIENLDIALDKLKNLR